jgi:hypothetical protein
MEYMVGNVGEARGRASRGYVAGEPGHFAEGEPRHTDAEESVTYGCRGKRDIPMPKDARHTEGRATYRRTRDIPKDARHTEGRATYGKGRSHGCSSYERFDGSRRQGERGEGMGRKRGRFARLQRPGWP